MPNQNSKNFSYSQRLKAIRPYVNFNYDLRHNLSPSDKAKITKYFKKIAPFLDLNKPGTPSQVPVYRPRRKDHLKAAQKFGMENADKNIKVAFLPTLNPQDKKKIKFNKRGELVLKSKYVDTRKIYFDVENLALDPVGEVADKLANAPDNWRYTIQAGEHQIVKSSHGKNDLAKEIIYYQNTYNNEESNHYWANWLHGVYAHNFKNQKDMQAYLAARTKEQAKKKTAYQTRKKGRYRTREKIFQYNAIKNHAGQATLDRLANQIEKDIKKYNVNTKWKRSK